MIGPGKYDELCTLVRSAACARGVVLIILGGDKGHGFCVQAPLELQVKLPALLRELADGIEADIKAGGLTRAAEGNE